MTKRRFLLISAVLSAFVSAWIHWPLARAGASFLISDWAHGYLEAEKLRLGDWTAFPYRHDYGGLTLGYARALWSAGWDALQFFPAEPWLGHMVFSFVVEPILMAWAILVLASRYLGRFGAGIAALIAAVGFRFWIDVYGNDFYVLSFCLGALLLAWRAGLRNPFLDLSRSGLLLACFLSGLAFYTFRASAIFIAAFFLPWEWTFRGAKEWLQPKDRVERSLVGLTLGFLGFYLYLGLFGTELGSLPDGRMLKLSAEPNLKFALILIAGLAARRHFGLLHGESGAWLRVRLGWAVGGFVAGFSPEIFSRMGEHEPRFTAQIHPTSLQDAIQAALRLPQSVLELLQADLSIARIASVSLALWAVFRLFRKSDESTRPLRFALALSIGLFCFVSTYTSATPRYLFPAFPITIIAIGILGQELRARRSKLLGLFGALVAAHLVQHTAAQSTFAEAQRASGGVERRVRIIEAFREAGVSVIVTETYADSNPLTLMSREKPVFVHTEWLAGKRFILRANEAVQRGERIGFLLSAKPGPHSSFRWNEVNWRLTRIAEQGEHGLYFGEPYTAATRD